MSWLDDLFRNPQLGYSPSLEPPGWNLLRDQLMRKIFSLQSNPYGYDPSQGRSMASLLPTGGRGRFDPYSGGYGSTWNTSGGGGSGSPMRPMTRTLGRDARMPVIPAPGRGTVGGGTGAPGPSSPEAPRPAAPPGAGGTTAARSGPDTGGHAEYTPGRGFTYYRNPPTSFGEDLGNALGDLAGREPAARPPDAYPGLGPPVYQGPPSPGPTGRPPLTGVNDQGREHYGPNFDGTRCMGDDASPYMFQQGPKMLGRDSWTPYGGGAPHLPNEGGYGPGGYNTLTGRAAPGWWMPLLRQYGINMTGMGPTTTFNRGGSSYLSSGASHEGAGPGGQSEWLYKLLGITPQGAPSGAGIHFDPRAYGQVRPLDQAMAAARTSNLQNFIRSGGAQRYLSAHPGMDIYGNSAMGSKLAPVQRAPGFESGMAPKQPGLPQQTIIPNEGNQVGGKQLAAGGNPDTSSVNRGPTQGNVKINVGQKPPEAPVATDGVRMGYDSPDPTNLLSPGGAAPTGADQGGVAKMLLDLIAGGGSPGMGMGDDIMRRRKVTGFDGTADLGQNRMKGYGVRDGNFPSPY